MCCVHVWVYAYHSHVIHVCMCTEARGLHWAFLRESPSLIWDSLSLNLKPMDSMTGWPVSPRHPPFSTSYPRLFFLNVGFSSSDSGPTLPTELLVTPASQKTWLSEGNRDMAAVLNILEFILCAIGPLIVRYKNKSLSSPGKEWNSVCFNMGIFKYLWYHLTNCNSLVT